MQQITDQFKGRWQSILVNAGIDAKCFTGKHQKCPLCHQGKDCYRWIADKEVMYCNKCGTHSGINAYIAWTGLTFKEACSKIRGNKVDYQKNEVKKKDPMPRLKRIHSKIKKIEEGDPVDVYLKSRGIADAFENVFTGSTMPYYGPGRIEGVYDVMVARITNVNGDLESYHLTYLGDNDFKRKIITAPRTSITGCAVQLCVPGETLAIAEGIETAMAVQQEEMPCWSAISANGMEKIKIPSTVKTVLVYADNDASFTGHASAYILAKRLKMEGKDVRVFVPDNVGDDYLDVFTS